MIPSIRALRAACLAAALAAVLAVVPALGVAQRGPDASTFEALASLTPTLAGVRGLTGAQRDSLARIEVAWRPRFRRNGEALLALFEEARAAGRAPDVDRVRALDTERRAAWLDELRAARALLREERQRARFDANVTSLLGGVPAEDPLGDGRTGVAPRRRVAPRPPRFA